jgi:hypothetical protein
LRYDLGQITISIPTASQNVFVNDTNARKIEQPVTWAKSRSRPEIEKTCEVAKNLYPAHFDGFNLQITHSGKMCNLDF